MVLLYEEEWDDREYEEALEQLIRSARRAAGERSEEALDELEASVRAFNKAQAAA